MKSSNKIVMLGGVDCSGHHAAELVKSVNGWTVRSASGIDSWAMMFRPARGKGDGLVEALAWVKSWVDTYPTLRSAFVRRYVLDAESARIVLGAAENCLICADWYAKSDTYEEHLAGNSAICRYCSPVKYHEDRAAIAA